jgi:pimeloyl-ACP methyl ester carboxylesterase
MTNSATIVAACLILASCSGESRQPAESAQPADQMVNIGTHSLQMHREGKGTPAIVIDAGITDGIDKLRPLQDRLAQKTTVITYNRAGYGRSEPGPFPRNCVREADELKALLDKAPPLSFTLRREYKELGAMAERMTAEWEAVADSAAKSTDPQDKARSAFFRAIASEHREMFGPSAKLIEGIPTLGDVPLVVIAAGKANPAFGPIAEEYQKYWIEQSRALAGKSTNAKFVIVPESSHYLYLDAPELVVANVLSLVN